ncbi:MAG: hypothetical protein Q6K08_01980, partial [Thermostichales cyanobacterium GMQP_bins_62]
MVDTPRTPPRSLTNLSSRLGNQTTALAIASSVGVPLSREIVQRKILSPSQMLDVYKLRKETGKALSTIIREMTGSDLPPDLERLYKRQELFELKVIYGVASLDLDTEEVDVQAALQWIREGSGVMNLDFCQRNNCLPIMEKVVTQGSQQERYLVVAMVEPGNLITQDEIKNRLRSRGLLLQRRVITPGDFQLLLDRFLSAIYDNISTEPQEEEEENVEDSAQVVAEEELEEEEDLQVTGKLEDIDLDITGL